MSNIFPGRDLEENGARAVPFGEQEWPLDQALIFRIWVDGKKLFMRRPGIQKVKILQSEENPMSTPGLASHRRPIPRFPGFLMKSGFDPGPAGMGTTGFS